MAQPEAHNFRLISHDTLSGFGNVGEGMSLQIAHQAGGASCGWRTNARRRISPRVDVTDPMKPRVIVQTDLPHRNVRSNSLEVCGDIMAVAYQTGTHGATPAGIELFDISAPEQPRSISFIDRSGPRSRGVHQLWFVDGKTIHCSSGAADFMPRNLKDDQCYTAIDVSNPTRPRELGRWWYPGTEERDRRRRCRGIRSSTPAGARTTPMYIRNVRTAPTSGISMAAPACSIFRISARPKLVGHWNPHPPFPGFTHTVMPLFERDLLVVSDECVRTEGADWPKLVWLLDARREDNLVSVATLPLPPMEEYAIGGRYGAHNLHENRPGPSFHSDTLVFGTYFGGGLRVHDITDPLQPKEVASFIPEPPEGSPMKAAMINDVYVDENRTVYAVDRFAGGLYVLELTL